MFIIWSRPVGTMSHSTGSAVIQYSRAGPLTVKAASSAAPAALALAAPPPASAAATFGGTSTVFASLSTSICPSPPLILWPASVQKSAPPPSARKPRRSMPSKSIAPTPGRSSSFLDDDRHVHLRRVDRADELVGPRRRERLFEFGVGDGGRLGRVGLLLLQRLRPALQVDVVRVGVRFRPHPVHRLARLQGQFFRAEVEVGDRHFLRLRSRSFRRGGRGGGDRPREGERRHREHRDLPQHVTSPGCGATSTGLKPWKAGCEATRRTQVHCWFCGGLEPA